MQWVYGWLLLLPAMALLALFTHYPAVANLWHSFRSTPKGDLPTKFVGLDNYQQLVEDANQAAAQAQQRLNTSNAVTGSTTATTAPKSGSGS